MKNILFKREGNLPQGDIFTLCALRLSKSLGIALEISSLRTWLSDMK